MASEKTFTHSLEYSVPFITPRQAQIACNSLKPDPILKPDELQAHYTAQDNVLVIRFEGASDRVIRVAANNVLENLKTVVECFEEFDSDQS